ncbi:MAG: competence protein ComEA [Oceanospirillaceae bacterium]|jgi:competence protein ComEA|uniref:ComEA family DNA-binding protein n=1 Tax=Marinobacterium litorale TaxID=404770 RepID=UPI000429522C|nr:helix-hairpin-helix domain-containing protein [Marinobacterium litorale]MBT00149.1 competence protein ComEA [Oceanospirillaceae bacterium]
MRPLLKALVLGAALFSPFLQAAPVNLNTATASELASALNGVGPAKAAAIVEYREANGGFSSVDELVEVSGIGDATLDKNRELIAVEAAEEPES